MGRSNQALYLALRAVSRILPFVPMRMAYGLAWLAGTASYYAFREPREALLRNLAHALNTPRGSRRVRVAARGAFRTDAANWLDTLRIHRLSALQILDLIDLRGGNYLEEALASGSGVIVVSLHLGNFDLVGQVLAARGNRVTVPVERMHPDKLFAFLQAQRASKGIHLVPVDQSPRALVKALRAGEIVGMTGDRGVAGRSALVDFFGTPTKMPRGPATLARLGGASIVFGAGLRLSSGRFRGELSAPIDLPWTGENEADEVAITQQIARSMETYVRRYPDQWLAFSPLWDNGEAIDGVATIGQQTKAAV